MIDEEVLVEKLRHINQYTDELHQMRGISIEAYENDVMRRRAVERTFMNLIQACIDLSRHIRRGLDRDPQESAKDEIVAIGDAGIISENVEAKMAEAVGFRNVLAHQYGDINDKTVYDILHNDLHWFERFQQQIAQWLQEQDINT